MYYNACFTRIVSNNPKKILSIADELGISGINVTSPFKSEMFKLMDDCDKDSTEIRAINTIILKYGKRYGYNTDIYGVVDTIKQKDIDLQNRNCLIAGYGNAAKAVSFGLKKEWKNVNIFVTGRSEEKVRKFAKKFDCNAFFSQKQNFKKAENINPYLIISTVPKNALQDIGKYFGDCEYFFDAAYPDSLMSNEAKKYNCKIITGEEWLLNQALASYKIFTDTVVPESFLNESKDSILKQIQNENKRTIKNILLTGFSGCGKTSIGKQLAEKLGYIYFDTDSIIAEQEDLSIKEIFKKKGEEYFRKIEKEILIKLIEQKNAVISCGGGILCDNEKKENGKINSNTFHLLSEENLVVWLHVPLEESLKRIDMIEKPMLFNRNQDEIENLYNERKILYCISSDLLVANTSELSKTVENIIYELKML